MNKYLLAILLLSGFHSFSQSSVEKGIINLSADIFKWEVGNKIDSLEKVFHEKFVVIGSDGNARLKNQYLQRLRNGSFVHDSISVEENTAIVSGNSGVVSGKGRFFVTISGNKAQLYLSYMEVFTRENNEKPWQVLAMKASVLK